MTKFIYSLTKESIGTVTQYWFERENHRCIPCVKGLRNHFTCKCIKNSCITCASSRATRLHHNITLSHVLDTEIFVFLIKINIIKMVVLVSAAVAAAAVLVVGAAATVVVLCVHTCRNDSFLEGDRCVPVGTIHYLKAIRMCL